MNAWMRRRIFDAEKKVIDRLDAQSIKNKEEEYKLLGVSAGPQVPVVPKYTSVYYS